MVTAQIAISKSKIAKFCQRWKVRELALFGSVLSSDFTPESDVDVLVTFTADAQISLFDMAQMKIELQDIFKRPVDILEKDALRNPFRKREILNSAQVVYAS